MNINFFFPERKISLSQRTGLKQFINKLVEKEGFKLNTLSYVFCSDRTLLKMNRDYLQHDYFTDIITFDLSSTKEIEGEVYISIDRVKENASQFETTFQRELHRVIFHGALHLCGYKDKSKSEIDEMRSAENFYLRQYFKKS